MWLSDWYAAEELRIKAKGMLRAVLVENKLVALKGHPFWHRGFPYAAARGFKLYDSEGKANVFWGFSYPRLLEASQKVLDESIAQVLLILQNHGVGRSYTIKGLIDRQRANQKPGGVTEIDPELLGNRGLRDAILPIPSNDVPVALFQFLSYIEAAMEGNTGINEVFSGQAPYSGASGRSISLLQSAAFSHISDLQRSLIGYHKRVARLKVNMIQQLAGAPLESHQGTRGVARGEFPERWRSLPYRIRVQESSQFPHSPAGKLDVALQLLGAGALQPEQFYDITGVDEIYGIQRMTESADVASQVQSLLQQGGGNKQ